MDLFHHRFTFQEPDGVRLCVDIRDPEKHSFKWLISTILIWQIHVGVFFSSGNPMFSPKNFEHTNSCNDKYLVEGKDFLIFEFEATGSNSTYPFNQGLFGPQFYYTTAIYNNIFSVRFNCICISISSIVYSLDLLLLLYVSLSLCILLFWFSVKLSNIFFQI